MYYAGNNDDNEKKISSKGIQKDKTKLDYMDFENVLNGVIFISQILVLDKE
jgi:hypothetical protein